MSSQSMYSNHGSELADKGGARGGKGSGSGLVWRGKENFAGRKEVEGLVIFAKRDGEVVCREQVLCALRAKRTELLGGTVS